MKQSVQRYIDRHHRRCIKCILSKWLQSANTVRTTWIKNYLIKNKYFLSIDNLKKAIFIFYM